jgi:hypothetical protein
VEQSEDRESRVHVLRGDSGGHLVQEVHHHRVHEASGFDVVLGDEQADAIAVLVPRDLGRELERAYSCLRSDLACVLGRQRQIPV